MKKYLKVLPLLLYPYAYLIFFFASILFSKWVAPILEVINYKVLFVLIILYNLLMLFLALRGAIVAFKRYTPTEAAKMNLAVKGWQIPAYIFHFLIGAAGSMASVWGLGFVAFAVAIDLATIFLSGLHAIGCVRRLRKEGVLSSETAFLTGLGSFIYCVDVFVAFYLVRLCKKKYPEERSKLFDGARRKLQSLGDTKPSVLIRKIFAYPLAAALAFYPYAYRVDFVETDGKVIIGLFYTLLIILLAIRSVTDAFSLHAPLAAAGLNLVVKVVQFFACFYNTTAGLFATLVGVWTMSLGFTAIFPILSAITILTSGLYSVGCIRRMKKEGILSSAAAVLTGIGSFIFGIDALVALGLVIVCFEKRKQPKRNEAASPNVVDVPPQEQQTAAALPLLPPSPAPAPNETGDETTREESERKETASPAPKPQGRRKPSEMPPPPPFTPVPPSPAPALNEAGDETARED